MKGVEQLQREATKQVEVGVISSDEKLKIDREVLKLKRELAGLDRNREEVNPGTASMMYYMQNPDLMKRYFPQMYAKMMASSGTNAPGLSVMTVFGAVTDASFIDRSPGAVMTT